MLNPTGGFSPMFTIIEAVGAMIYGIFLYELQPVSVRSGEGMKGFFSKQKLLSTLSIICSKVAVVIVCNLIMTPAAMAISGYMTWEAMLAAYPLRVIKNAIQCPVDCVIMLLILFPILMAYRRIFPAAYENTSEGQTDKAYNTEQE